MPTTLTDFFTEQREKFQKQRDDARAKLEEAETELRALDAYDAAKKAKAFKASDSDGPKNPRKPRDSGKRIKVLQLVQEFPDGATSSELQERLGIKGDKKATQSLSNALSALKRDNKIILENGTYRAA